MISKKIIITSWFQAIYIYENLFWFKVNKEEVCENPTFNSKTVCKSFYGRPEQKLAKNFPLLILRNSVDNVIIYIFFQNRQNFCYAISKVKCHYITISGALILHFFCYCLMWDFYQPHPYKPYLVFEKRASLWLYILPPFFCCPFPTATTYQNYQNWYLKKWKFTLWLRPRKTWKKTRRRYKHFSIRLDHSNPKFIGIWTKKKRRDRSIDSL